MPADEVVFSGGGRVVWVGLGWVGMQMRCNVGDARCGGTVIPYQAFMSVVVELSCLVCIAASKLTAQTSAYSARTLRIMSVMKKPQF